VEKRLDRVLSNAGFGTRSGVRNMIRAGRVCVSGAVARLPEMKVSPGGDEILLDGKRICCKEHVCIMLNKPAGVLSASRDRARETVMDLLPEELRKRRLFPVGRLDRDTVGLLLITDDGGLCHGLLSPGRHVDKLYHAEVEGRLTREDEEAFWRGIPLADGETCLPARLEILESGEGRSTARVTITEGKYHQLKRMFRARGARVRYLKRLGMGPLLLDPDLPEGEHRPLREEEIRRLYACADMKYGEND